MPVNLDQTPILPRSSITKATEIQDTTTYLVVVFSVERDDVEVEDGALRDDDDDGGEAEEAVIEDLPIAHVVGRVGLLLRRAAVRNVHQITLTNVGSHSSTYLVSNGFNLVSKVPMEGTRVVSQRQSSTRMSRKPRYHQHRRCHTLVSFTKDEKRLTKASKVVYVGLFPLPSHSHSLTIIMLPPSHRFASAPLVRN